VKLGKGSPEMAVIEEGVKPGDQVIAEGVQKVRPGQPVNPAPAAPPPGQAVPRSDAAPPAAAAASRKG
jgi:membrane fusion protein (multidrug efflux system)